MKFVLDTVLVVLMVDFVSGVLHWLEDGYGKRDWPITGALITAPNILHHHRPAAFIKHSWLKSADVLICLGAVIMIIAWAGGMLTWQVLLFVAIGVNANEVHKWNHLPKSKRSEFVVVLQKLRLLQTSEHHAKHHALSKDTNYCVITNVMNPVLDAVQFWRKLEWTIQCFFGVSKRPSLEDDPVAKRCG
ncbi:MAG: fatty acid desaturase CarF family protein [Gammaproteobacteria bacterium]|nr:fatty acid desaturase CarF family protein [Gammaproteobacteria bacterium]MDX2458952.1 fatty acid desaturase CarF family protein [Gammaproteobacteria bacterium]